MKQIYSNLKHGELKLQAESQDDLWTLSQVIDLGDFVSGRTIRKVKLGTDDDRNANIIKKPVFVTVSCEKVELNGSLRVSGKITAGPDDISRGVYHTIDVEAGTTIAITKEQWLSYQLDKVKEACRSKVSNIIVVVMDREEAYFAKLKSQGYDVLSHVEGDVPKKGNEQRTGKDFYAELASAIGEYASRYKPAKIIVASPSFWKEDLLKKITDPSVTSRVILSTCSSVSVSGINEVLRRPEITAALREERLAEEIAVVEELLAQIAKEGVAVYGPAEVKLAVEAGAVKTLLVADSYLKQKREQRQFAALEQIMKAVEQRKGSVKLISVEHEAGKKLMGLGGIAALTRYKLNT